MTRVAQPSADLYHYSENGTPRGPFTVQQLQELAASGKIQPQTFIWKAGFQAWVPAKSVRGLLPKEVPSPRPLAYPATMLERKRPRSQRPRWIVVGSLVVEAKEPPSA